MKRWLICLGVCIFLIISLYGHIWLTPPDNQYVQHLFEHSQWRLPLSSRIMSDEKLYQYAGSYIIRTGDLFTVNPEVPPLAKYVYGWSQTLTGNPYLINPGLMLVAIVSFYLLSRKMGNSSHHSRWLVLVLLISPIFLGQLSQTMLDLPQLTFLLVYLVLLVQLSDKHSHRLNLGLSISAGVALGAMAASKIPVVIPLILIVSSYYLWRIKRWWFILPLSVVTGLTYSLSYLAFFLAGHNLIEWFRAQKWMIDFYRQGQVEANHLMLLISVMTGWYRGWWDQPWQRIVEWSSLWPVSFLAPLWSGLRRWRIRQFSPIQQLLFLVFASQLVLNFVLPFWPRYYLLLFPFGLLFLPSLFASLPKKLTLPTCILLIGLLVIEFGLFIRPLPNHDVMLATSSWQKSHYQDLYQYVSPLDRAEIEPKIFNESLKKIEWATSRPVITVPTVFTWPWQSKAVTEIQLSYSTPIGVYTHSSQLHLTRQGQTWVIDWDWSAALPDFTPDSVITFIPEYPYYGQLSTFDRTVLSLDGLIPDLYVVPNDVQAQTALPVLAAATGLGTNQIEARLFVDSIGPWPTRFPLLPTIDQELVEALQTTPGVQLIPKPGRLLSPIIFNYQAYEWEKNIEFTHPELNGQLGGKLLLFSPQQPAKVLLSEPAVNGQDVVIEETAQALFYEPVARQPNEK